MFQFIHAADIHLDSPLHGLEQYEGAPVEEIREAARRALVHLVDFAIEKQVAFVLIAGDLYDGDWNDYNTGLFFVSQAARLNAKNIPLLVIAGNHDAANKMTRTLPLPANTTLFDSSQPQTVILENIGAAVHGQSFAAAAVQHDLSAHYPSPNKNYFNIGMLHTNAGSREGHSNYAPCTLEGLKLKGYDYWALGHIHKREILCDEPYIVYCGNLQGRHARETGEKGCLLVSVEDDRSCSLEFQPLDVLRWEIAEVNATDAETLEELQHRAEREIQSLLAAAGGRTLVVRVQLCGATHLHYELLDRREHFTEGIRALAIGLGNVWIEKVKFLTTVPQTSTAEIPAGAMQELHAALAAVKADPGLLAELNFDFHDVINKLPEELKLLAPQENAAWWQEVVAEAEAVLMHPLQGRKESE